MYDWVEEGGSISPAAPHSPLCGLQSLAPGSAQPLSPRGMTRGLVTLVTVSLRPQEVPVGTSETRRAGLPGVRGSAAGAGSGI